MQTYYLYFMGGTGRIQQRRDVEAEDDAAAVALADRLKDGRAMELWFGARRIWSCDAEPFRGQESAG